MVEIVEGSGVVLAVTMFVLAAAAKAVEKDSLRTTVAALGVPPRISRTLVPALPLLEFGTAASFALFPSSTLSQIAIAALCGVFGALGAWTLIRGQSVQCACFGRIRPDARLGLSQMVAAPAALGLVWLLHASPPSWSAETRASGFVLCVLVAAAVMLVASTGDWFRTRGARISLAQARLLIRSVAFEVERA